MARLTRSLIMVGFFVGCLAVGFRIMLGSHDQMRLSTAVGGSFHLVDQHGASVTDMSIKGRPSLIFFGFTHCPDVCPTTLFEISETLRAMGADAERINVFFVSVDPERDTDKIIEQYLQSFDPHIRGLTGSQDDVKTILTAYRVYAKRVRLKDGDYTFDHSASVYLMDRTGKYVPSFRLMRSPEGTAADLRRFF